MANRESQATDCYRAFICATVAALKSIRNNPTTKKIDDILIDLQTLTMDQ